MAITTIYTYSLDGSKREFTVPFEYLARRFVVLTLIGTDRKELELTKDYRFISKTAVQTTVAWGPGDGYERIEVRRNTSATERLVDFADGSILRASELNTSQVQTLHVAEEARNMVADTIATNQDGDLDARGRRLVNLADATEAGHAITMRQSLEWADSALNSKVNAKASEVNAKASEVKAKASEVNAKASEVNAKASEVNAKASEVNAKAEAAKLGNANAFMGAISSVDESNRNIFWKDGWTLVSDRAAVGPADGTVRLQLSKDALGRNGQLSVYASGHINLQPTGGAVRVLSENPLVHYRTANKMCAYMNAPGDSTATIAVYDSEGANAKKFTFRQDGALSIDGDFTGTGLRLAERSVAAVGGRAIVVAKTSPWMDFKASGANPPGVNRITHGLGRTALGYHVQFLCKEPDAGYVVGDVITPVDMNYHSSTTSARGGQLVFVDDNTVDYFVGGTGQVLIHKNTGAATSMTHARWQIRVTAIGIANG